MKLSIYMVAIAAVLSGCQGSIVGDAMAGKEGLAQQDNDYCVSIGAQPGTDAYVQCRIQMTTNRENRHASARSRIAAINAANTYSMNQNRMRTTNCNRFGNSVNCTTW